MGRKCTALKSRSQWPLSGILQKDVKLDMEINLSDKEIKTLARLDIALQSNMVPVNDLRDFVTGLRQKVMTSAGGSGKKRNPLKQDRKDHYRLKLKVA